MYDENNYDLMEQERLAETQQRVSLYLAKVMGWMCVGLLTTLAATLICLAMPSVARMLYSGNMVYAVVIAQLVVVVAMSAGMRRMSPAVATVMFMLYAALTGVTFTALGLLFGLASLFFVFGLTAFIFVGMAIYGFVTRKDLTRAGSLAFFGLLGIILAGVVNWFLGSAMVDFAVTVIGIVIFIVLTAYDTQKIKNIYLSAADAGVDDDHPELRKLAIYGAFTLYLDFINLFLKLLRLLGRRRN